MSKQLSLLDADIRLEERSVDGNSLEHLAAMVDFEWFRPNAWEVRQALSRREWRVPDAAELSFSDPH